MTTTVRPDTTTPAQTDWTRKYAASAGALYLITFIASIPAALFLITPVLKNSDYIVSAGADTQVLLGCFLDVVNALACVGTAVAVFPVVKRQNEALALGFVTSRVVEAAIILPGVMSLLAVVTLRQDFAGGAGGDQASLISAGQALVAVRDWTFLLGPSLMAGINALLFGTLMYQSRLVPRIIPTMGLIGAPLLITATIATLFGYNEQMSAWSTLATLPVAAWELSVGTWMLVKGFNPSAVAAITESGDADRRAVPVA